MQAWYIGRGESLKDLYGAAPYPPESLSELGVQEANRAGHLMAATLAGLSLDALIIPPHAPTRHTAHIIAGILGFNRLTLIEDPTFNDRYPDETDAEFSVRAKQGLMRIEEPYPGSNHPVDRVLVVGGVDYGNQLQTIISPQLEPTRLVLGSTVALLPPMEEAAST